MSITDAHIAAIITGAAGISGVLLGNFFVAIKEWIVSGKSSRSKRAYLAILVVSHLDRFANGCVCVGNDDGTCEGRPAGGNGEYFQTTVTPPLFLPLDIEVEWQTLPTDLLYEIFQIPEKHEQIAIRLSNVWEYDDPPDYNIFFSTRQRDYAELGIHVSAVAKRLRRHATLPVQDQGLLDWSREAELQKIIDRVDSERAAQNKRRAEARLKFVDYPLAPG
ncbi:MAG: hypothetical protein Q8M77_03610 [Hydrogenophaga sp.]|nr:hypothetical protein [Hydrogenophaga sp.]